jgi:hypothetical protein
MNVHVDKWVRRTNEWLKVILLLQQGELIFLIWGGYRDKKKSLSSFVNVDYYYWLAQYAYVATD